MPIIISKSKSVPQSEPSPSTSSVLSLTPADYGLPSSRFPSFRVRQEDTALSIAESDQRFIFLAAPPGTGKSLIHMTVAQALNARTLILVGTKGLQSQYTSDFGSIGMVDVRGHSNYPCGIGKSSGVGPQNLVPSRGGGSRGARDEVCSVEPQYCHQLAAVGIANSSRLVVSNYSYWLTLERTFKSNTLGSFDLLILDEAHTAHDWLAGFCSFFLAHSDVRRLLDIDPVEPGMSFHEWAEGAVEVARYEYREARREGKGEDDLRDLAGLGRSLANLVETSTLYGTEWLIDRQRAGVQVSPPWAAPFAETYLFRSVPKVVLSSATLTTDTARHLGIGKSEFEMYDLPSTFHHKNRPVIWVPTTRVDHRISEGQIRMVMNRIDTVIEGRRDRKGLIQSQSYQWTEQILRRSKYRDLMISHGRGGSKKAVEEWMRAKSPSVLVSPAVKEGFDFKDDLCRWQVVLKIPWVYGKDPVVAARSKTDKGYTTYLASQDFMQMCGRVVRSGDDWGETFIFDDHFSYFRNKGKFPKWLKRGFVVMDSVPDPPPLGGFE